MIGVEQKILQLNFVEFLTSFLDKKVNFAMVLELNERIYERDHRTLSQPLQEVTTTLHDVKKQIDRGEVIGTESIHTLVNNSVLMLI